MIFKFMLKVDSKRAGYHVPSSIAATWKPIKRPCNSGSFIRQYMQFLSHSRRFHSRCGKNSILLLFLKEAVKNLVSLESESF